jgi:hypothetical protein
MSSTAPPPILDTASFPSLVDLVVAYVDHKTRIALWGTSRTLHKHLTAHFYRHMVLSRDTFVTSDRRRLPTKSVGEKRAAEITQNLARCRILDLDRSRYWFASLASTPDLTGLRTLRATCGYYDAEAPPTVTTLVFRGTSDQQNYYDGFSGEHRFDPSVFGLNNGPQRIVFNIAYKWPQQLFASCFDTTCRSPSFPASLKELVFHFKKVGDRPRVFRGKDPESYPPSPPLPEREHIPSLSATALRSFHKEAEASPEVMEAVQGEQWQLRSTSVNRVRKSLFELIADRFATAIDRDMHVPKLTIVGLEDFDLHRDADAADDKIIADFLPVGLAAGLFTQEEVDSAEYAHPPYEAMAPTFVDSILDRLDKSHHEVVLRKVKLLTPARYVAGLEHPADEEWWLPEHA